MDSADGIFPDQLKLQSYITNIAESDTVNTMALFGGEGGHNSI